MQLKATTAAILRSVYKLWQVWGMHVEGVKLPQYAIEVHASTCGDEHTSVASVGPIQSVSIYFVNI